MWQVVTASPAARTKDVKQPEATPGWKALLKAAWSLSAARAAQVPALETPEAR